MLQKAVESIILPFLVVCSPIIFPKEIFCTPFYSPKCLFVVFKWLVFSYTLSFSHFGENMKTIIIMIVSSPLGIRGREDPRFLSTKLPFKIIFFCPLQITCSRFRFVLFCPKLVVNLSLHCPYIYIVQHNMPSLLYLYYIVVEPPPIPLLHSFIYTPTHKHRHLLSGTMDRRNLIIYQQLFSIQQKSDLMRKENGRSFTPTHNYMHARPSLHAAGRSGRRRTIAETSLRLAGFHDLTVRTAVATGTIVLGRNRSVAHHPVVSAAWQSRLQSAHGLLWIIWHSFVTPIRIRVHARHRCRRRHGVRMRRIRWGGHDRPPSHRIRSRIYIIWLSRRLKRGREKDLVIGGEGWCDNITRLPADY